MQKNRSGPTNDYLHENPHLYRKVFDVEAGKICIDLCDEFCERRPATALDVGCGPGREVAYFNQHGIQSIGIDWVPTMIAHARAHYPDNEFYVADLRNFRINKTFDMVTCLGSCLNYMLTNADLTAALISIREHCHPGSLVIIEPLNTSSFVGSNVPPSEFHIADSNTVAKATYAWDQSNQIMRREREWTTDDHAVPIRDTLTVRLLFSQELKFVLESVGFKLLGFRERQRSKIYLNALFLIASYDPK
jgi:SAM-dependent methyltransferase